MPYLSCGHCSACAKGKTNCCRNLEVLGVHRDGGMTGIHRRAGAVRSQGRWPDARPDLDGGIPARLARTRWNARRCGPEIGCWSWARALSEWAVLLFASLKGARISVLDGRQRSPRLHATPRSCRETLLSARCGYAHATARRSARGRCSTWSSTARATFARWRPASTTLAHGGSYVLVSIVSERVSFSDPEFHRREATLLGSRNATLADVSRVMDAIRSGRVDTAAVTAA